jgi:hypothetical protein
MLWSFLLLACADQYLAANLGRSPPSVEQETGSEGSGDEGGDGSEGDSGLLPELDCASLPDVTYDNWGKGKIDTHCQGCHHSQAAQRYGAPEGVSFDTEEEVRVWRERIYVRSLESEDMPPAGGLTEDEKTLLEIFLVCGL